MSDKLEALKYSVSMIHRSTDRRNVHILEEAIELVATLESELAATKQKLEAAEQAIRESQEALNWIAQVNAMDYEYRSVAKQALAKQPNSQAHSELEKMLLEAKIGDENRSHLKGGATRLDFLDSTKEQKCRHLKWT